MKLPTGPSGPASEIWIVFAIRPLAPAGDKAFGMFDQPFMFYVFAIIIIKYDIAVVCYTLSKMFKQHYPGCRIVISQWGTENKY